MTADGRVDPLRAAVERALGSEGPFAREHAGYVVREGQVGLAVAVADAIANGESLIAEAGTGTGKTFAYLVPALLAGGRVLISTGTRNLQDQLFDRDLPEVARALGVRAETALLKGRGNYVCRFHLARNLAEGRFARREDIAELRRIERFAALSETGDRAGLAGLPEDAPAWSMANSTRENCLGQDCPDVGRCFVVKARQAAMRADVVVVNHHLLCADLALRDEGVADLLPTADALIFDEAHQLPEAATQFFGRSVSTRQLLDLARDALRAGMAEARDAARWAEVAGAIEQAVRELRLHAGTPGRLDAGAAMARTSLVRAIDAACAALEAAAATLAGCAERGPELARCAQRATELQGAIRDWVAHAGGGAKPAPAGERGRSDAPGEEGEDGANDGGEGDGGDAGDAMVTWAEVHRGGATLHSTPLSVAPVFRRHREARPRAWVFVSATLAVGGDVSHFARSVGAEQARALVWPSPFDFAAQALLYVPTGIGEPAGEDFAERVAAAAWPLLRANRGRAFVLCTTLRMVERVARELREAMEGESEPMQLLVQGYGSRAELLERFRREPAPVLVGSASFWEGVDVPGRQLSLVIIDKLPFAPPDDPVLRARIDAARRAGEDPFRTLQLPAAAMTLKQGAGRLIRSESDRGVLMVCDARLAERSYGRVMVRSLPPFRRTRSLDEALAFLAGAA